jgi:hypothetical protein
LGLRWHASHKSIVEVLCIQATWLGKHHACSDIADSVNLKASFVRVAFRLLRELYESGNFTVVACV